MRVKSLQGIGKTLFDGGLSKDKTKYFIEKSNHNEQLPVEVTSVFSVVKTVLLDVVSSVISIGEVRNMFFVVNDGVTDVQSMEIKKHVFGLINLIFD
jgi:hypothetical protein